MRLISGKETIMTNEMNLLLAFIDAVGYDVKESNGEYSVTKRPKAASVPRETSKNEYTDEFEMLWADYPKRIGKSSKVDAYKAYNARLKEAKPETNEHLLMITGMDRYSEFLKAIGNNNTEFVMMASTFLGASKNYMQEWAKPAIRADIIKLPTMDDDLLSFATKHGLSQARAGEKYPEWRKRLSAELSILNNREG